MSSILPASIITIPSPDLTLLPPLPLSPPPANQALTVTHTQNQKSPPAEAIWDNGQAPKLSLSSNTEDQTESPEHAVCSSIHLLIT